LEYVVSITHNKQFIVSIQISQNLENY